MSTKKKSANNPFVFKAHMKIGEPGAEDDGAYLKDCFVHSSDLEVLLDTNAPQRIVLGRTGMGKSALLSRIMDSKKSCVNIDPDELSLNYIANSTILQFFESLGVKLDIFYQLLWRHTFVVTLLRDKYGIVNEQAKKTCLSRLSEVFIRDKTKKAAVEYIEKWGSSFWLETESRVKEVTSAIESSLKAGVDLSDLGVPISASGAQQLTSETKEEIAHRAQAVVNQVQIQALSKVFDLLDQDVFNDQSKPHYIIIDRLDENWIDDRLRYKLIRALMETIKHFKKVHNVKVIIALRSDLLDRVIQHTRDSGFQEEKYESLFLKLRWNKQQLQELLESRVNLLVRKQYSGQKIGLADIVPPKIIEQTFMDFLFDRTLMRPRDVIVFMNTYLARMEGQHKITTTLVHEAEAEYSKSRLRALFDEWNTDYPNIAEYYSLLQGREPHFALSVLEEQNVGNFALTLGAFEGIDPMIEIAVQYIEGTKSKDCFLARWSKTLYRIGLIGIKPDANSSTLWSYQADAVISEHQINPESIIYIHPMFWRGLGIHAKNSKRFIKSL